ncbi:MAG TPA: hypothetical protein PKM73_07435 [Verrucomicrobiota bacterium]|nr:hypothetical protein [Verrucomicrobiota bacterium]HNU51281.1 hypothetical protein [Verrucomicrobiota bacterium]
MKWPVKIVVYGVLIAGALVCGQRFLAGFGHRMDRAASRYDTEEAGRAAPVHQPAAGLDATNDVPVVTTNVVPATTEPGEGEASTNGPSAAAGVSAAPPASAAAAPASARASGLHWGVYAALTLGLVVVLSLMVANEIAHYVATRAHRELYNEEGEGIGDPEYDQAEQAWANGDHLEAVRLLRSYLERNPREIHVAFRIAEIYENNLGNALAAALEYEEILRHKLSAERWGWAAVHLCNLYNRLNQPEKTEALLRRIVAEQPGTAAARKAREHLGITEDAVPAGEPEATADSGGPRLPPGFRPKKR